MDTVTSTSLLWELKAPSDSFAQWEEEGEEKAVFTRESITKDHVKCDRRNEREFESVIIRTFIENNTSERDSDAVLLRHLLQSVDTFHELLLALVKKRLRPFVCLLLLLAQLLQLI